MTVEFDFDKLDMVFETCRGSGFDQGDMNHLRGDPGQRAAGD